MNKRSRSYQQNRKRRIENRRFIFELLEHRRLLTHAELAAVQELLPRDLISAVTFVTHGFQVSNDGGDSLMPLASAIRDRLDEDNGPSLGSYLLDLDILAEGSSSVIDLAQSTLPNLNSSVSRRQPGEVVVLFDWAPESNELTDGWTTAGGTRYSVCLLQWVPSTH